MAFREVDPGPAPEGNFVRFTAIGDKFLGLFVRYQRRTANFPDGAREVDEYVFRNKEGEHTLTANYDLNRRLVAAKLEPGHLVRITYASELPPRQANQSPMKVFKVEVDTDYRPPARQPPPPPPPPTNGYDDIPF